MSQSAFTYTFSFFLRHAPVILSVSLIVAISRVIQVGWEGYLPVVVFVILEIVVLAARVAIALIAIGEGALGPGLKKVRTIVRLSEAEKSAAFARMGQTIKEQWRAVLRDILLFGLTAIAINYVIGEVSQTRTVYSLMTSWGVPGSNEDSVQAAATLFMKNLTVIPLTIVFQYGIVRYLLRQERIERTAAVEGS